VGGGSTGNISIMLWPWHTAALGFGVQMKILAVQVTNLVPVTNTAVEAFDTVEDGYVAVQAGEDDEDF
jgi:hypothetical protein